MLLPSEVREPVSNLLLKVRSLRRAEVKERRAPTLNALRAKRRRNETEPVFRTKTTGRVLVRLAAGKMAIGQTLEDALAKGRNFARTPEEVPPVNLVAAAQTAVRNDKLPEAESQHVRLKTSAALTRAEAPASDVAARETRALAPLAKDEDVAVLPAHKGRRAVVLNAADYHTEILRLPSRRFGYVDDARVDVQTRESEAFSARLRREDNADVKRDGPAVCAISADCLPI